MSCCGTKRNELNARMPARPGTGPAGAAPATPAFGAAAGPATRGLEFEYVGGSVLTVVGQGTGLQYRFVGHGARASVDPRDRQSLAAVPQLRAVAARR